MKEKKITRILRIFMMLLTCILIALFFGIMILVSDMQGTARVVNYAGLCVERRSRSSNWKMHRDHRMK